MGPYESRSAESEWFRDRDSRCPPAEIDSQLANAGYRVRSSDLRHVAQRLERLESAMASGTSRDSGDGLGLAAPLDQQLLTAASEAVHYNPADLASWVDSMISEFAPDPPVSHHERTEELLEPVPCTAQHQQKQQRQLPLPVYPQQVTQPEEDNGIRLVHLLMTCAESVQRGEVRLASSLVEEMRLLLGRVNTKVGIGKVAGYFIDALTRRLYTSQAACAGSAPENEFLYHHFYEACPYLKFAHFTTNQAILEAFNGHDFVHVIDFNLMQGLQWPALIQALALRPGGPPFLRLTGIGPPSPDGRDSIREVGLRLAELARSVHVRFAFRGVAVSRLDDVRPWMLQVQPNEAVAVNSVMRLHRLLAEPETIESVLGLIRRLKPKIVTVVEQEADHNKPGFLDRFTEALFYYSTLFDSLAAGMGGGGDGAQQTQRAMAEVYLQREICNIVCCEGPARVERHEPLARWRVRMGQAGFKETHLGSNAFKQASMLLTLFSVEGYCVEEVDGCLTLGWHSRPLISASAWRADEEDNDVAPYPAAVTILNSANPNYNSSHHHLNNSITTNNIGSNCTGSSSGSSTVSNAMVQ